MRRSADAVRKLASVTPSFSLSPCHRLCFHGPQILIVFLPSCFGTFLQLVSPRFMLFTISPRLGPHLSASASFFSSTRLLSVLLFAPLPFLTLITIIASIFLVSIVMSSVANAVVAIANVALVSTD